MRDSDIILMGVCGTGKTSVGLALADALGRPFVEGDDFHPGTNRAKMAGGTPLTNADRKGWIEALCAGVNEGSSAVVACSALNPEVRSWLAGGLSRSVTYVHLTAPRAVILQRMASREQHFMRPKMLDSQLAAMDPPDDALTVSVDQPLNAVVADVLQALDEQA